MPAFTPRLAITTLSLSAVLLSACTTPMTPAATLEAPPKPGPALRQATPEAPSPRRAALTAIGLKPLEKAEAARYMDACAEEIEVVLKGSGVTLTRKGSDLVITFPGDQSFDAGRSSLEPRVFGLLNNLALVLNRYHSTYVDILGHADPSGRRSANDQLSEDRARSTAGYLVDKSVAFQRLSVAGVGSAYPIASNDDPKGRAMNRRVEIVIRPML
jgi:outer membrane protein OmpA-like peptidoglycan-associated protein